MKHEKAKRAVKGRLINPILMRKMESSKWKIQPAGTSFVFG